MVRVFLVQIRKTPTEIVQQPAKTEVIPAALPPPQGLPSLNETIVYNVVTFRMTVLEPVALQPEQITVAPVELKVEKKQKPEPKPEPVPGPAPEPKVEKMEEKAPPAPKEAKEDVDIEKMTDEEVRKGYYRPDMTERSFFFWLTCQLEAMMAAKMGGKMGKMKGGKREKKKKKVGVLFMIINPL